MFFLPLGPIAFMQYDMGIDIIVNSHIIYYFINWRDIMWIKSYSKIFQGVKKEAVWRIWAEVDRYPQWHDDLDYCKLHGKFAVGSYFMLKPKGAPMFKVEITEIMENTKFVDCTRFWGAKMFDIHELEETSNGLLIKNTIKVTGLLSYLWVGLVAKKVASSAPREMESTVKLARNICG
jgi:hypothetical protein